VGEDPSGGREAGVGGAEFDRGDLGLFKPQR